MFKSLNDSVILHSSPSPGRHPQDSGNEILWLSTTVNTSLIDNDNPASKMELILQGGSLAVIGLLSLLGNLLVTFSLVRRDQLHFPSNRLVFNLTASNFAFSLLVLPFIIASVAEQKWLFGIFWCNFTAFLTLFIGSASVITLAMIAIDRYYAIVKPMAYTVTITSSKSTAMLLWVWIQACTCSLPPLFGWSKFEFQEGQAVCMVSWWESQFYTVYLLTTCIFIPFTVMLSCYYCIFQVAKNKSLNTINDVETSTSVSNQHHHVLPKYRKLSNSMKQSLTLLSYQLMTKGLWTICVVIGAFVVTWFPYSLLALWQSSCGPACAPKWFRVSSTWLMYASGVSYPIVYGVYNRAIRKEMVVWLFHSNVKNAMKSLPSRNSHQRGSFTSSLLEYSPFRVRDPLRKNTINFKTRASIDLGILALANLALRKGSQDSGTVMTESEVENNHPSSFWFRRRHSASNVFRLSTQASRTKRDSPIVPTVITSHENESSALPILSIINMPSSGQPMQSLAGDIIIHSHEQNTDHLFKRETGFERQKRGASVDEGIVNDFSTEEVC